MKSADNQFILSVRHSIMAGWAISVLTLILIFLWGDFDVAAATVPTSPENGIPLIEIHVTEQELTEEDDGNSYGSIQDMLTGADHKVRCHGSVEVKVPDGYDVQGGDVGEFDLSYIRGRGNSTWSGTGGKNPFKIKLKKKTNFFGMGKAKEWALMANCFDLTLIKNRITSWLCGEMGMEYVPLMVPVDLVMTGDQSGSTYLGSYCLSTLVEIDENRVNIDELKKTVSDESGDPNITGGYLLAIYNGAQKPDTPDEAHFTTEAGVEFVIKDPEYDASSEELTEGEMKQRAYIRDYFQELEDLILKSETIDEETHNKIGEMMDLQAAADYWLVQDFSINGDAYATSSTYLYKKRNGKLYWGPAWDFDGAWGCQAISEDDEDYNYEGSYEGLNEASMLWIDELREKDPYFIELLKSRWTVMEAAVSQLTSDGGIIDHYRDNLSASRYQDYLVWKDRDDVTEDYGQHIDSLKTWIDLRRTWFGNHIDELDRVSYIVTFEADGETIATKKVRDGFISDEPEAPEKDGYIFLGWFEKESQEELTDYRIKKDTIFVAKYIEKNRVIEPEGLYFAKDEDWVSLSDAWYNSNERELIPENTTIKTIKWSSSDENIASVEEDGTVSFEKAGDVVITGTLNNGISSSYTLHIYDPDTVAPVEPDAVKLIPDTLTIQKGEQSQIKYRLQPEGNVFGTGTVEFESDDNSIAEVDNFGLVKGLSPGTTTVRVRVTCEDGDGDGSVQSQDGNETGQAQDGEGTDQNQGGDEASQNGKVLTATCQVTVEDTGQSGKTSVQKIRLKGISHKIAAGRKIHLSTTILPQGVSNKKLRWTSSNKKIATVNQKGLVTIKKKTGGKKVTITATATDGSGKKATWKIAVMKGAVKKITFKKTKKTLKAGKAMKLRAVVKTTKGKANKKLTWTSSNKKYAVVSASGKVKALKAGKGKSVVITARATDGSNKKKKIRIRIK